MRYAKIAGAKIMITPKIIKATGNAFIIL